MSMVLRMLLVFTAIWAVLRLLGRVLGSERRGGARRTRAGGATAPEKLVQDPSCGIWIPERRALKAAGPDGTRYFCSEDCRAKHATAG